MGPVDEGRGDELLVRHHDVLAVIGLQDRRTHAQFPDCSGAAVLQFDVVADRERAVEQDDHAGDEVGRDLLQAEAQADADRAAEHDQRGQVDPRDLQEQKTEDDDQGNLEGLQRQFAGRVVERRAGADQVQPLGVRHPADPEQQDAEDQGPE